MKDTLVLNGKMTLHLKAGDSNHKKFLDFIFICRSTDSIVSEDAVIEPNCCNFSIGVRLG